MSPIGWEVAPTVQNRRRPDGNGVNRTRHPTALISFSIQVPNKMSRWSLVVVVLFALMAGCSKFHHRPSGVTGSAVWVDGVFIDCEVEASMKADRCTVFGDKTGAILADGLFVLDSSKGPASRAELRYAAFRDRTIFLVDARTLSLLLASERDPTNRRIMDSLKRISSAAHGQPVDCGKTPTNNPDEKAGECAVHAFESRRPFYVRYYVPGTIYDYSYGLAGDSNGNVFEVAYNGKGINKLGLSKKTQLSEDGQLAVMPCPKPTSVIKTGEGTVACALPVTKQGQSGLVQQIPIDTSICEIATNPWAFNNKIVRVHGHVSGNFEYSEIEGDGCDQSIWFAYGDSSGPPGLAAYVAGGAMPGGENDEGGRTAPVDVKLIRDSNFRKFERLMVARVKADARSEKVNPDHPVFHRVTATFIGRIDGVTPEIHAAHLKRSPMDRADYLGFGQMGLFDAQLVVQSVEGDAVLGLEKGGSN
jgi:hypothetical protein